MPKFVIGRSIQAVVTLFVTSFAIFALSYSSGSPADLLLGRDASAKERAAFIERMGWDRPLPVQYWRFLKDALQGEFGVSLRMQEPVTSVVGARIMPSLKLTAVALAITVIISMPLGVLGAVRRGQWVDRAALSFALVGQAAPAFFLALGSILVFAVWLKWFPTSGTGTWLHYVLPGVTLGWGISAGMVRLLRASMLDVLDSEYVKLARVKGLHEGAVVWKHAMRNALIPVVTFMGYTYGHILAAAIITETVFAWPGLGKLTYDAIIWRDFPVLQLAVLVWVSIIILINFLVDLSYGVMDPRIRIGE